MKQRYRRLEWNSERIARRFDFGLITGPLLAGLAYIGGGSAATGGAIVAGTASTLASIGTSVAAANKPTPKIEPVTPPTTAQATSAVAQERQKTAARAGYRSTMLTSQLAQYSANPTGKTTFGG